MTGRGRSRGRARTSHSPSASSWYSFRRASARISERLVDLLGRARHAHLASRVPSWKVAWPSLTRGSLAFSANQAHGESAADVLPASASALPSSVSEYDAAAFRLFALHQTLVLQQLQRRVDRARTGPPHAAAALFEVLDDLIAVHRPGRQRLQHQVAHHAAPVAASGAEAAAAVRAVGTVRPEHEAAGAPAARAEAPLA